MDNDFNPILPEDSDFMDGLEDLTPKVVNEGIVYNDKKALSVLNLVNLANIHIEDMTSCRQSVKEATQILNESMYKMSVKELMEFMKVKVREMEVHAKSIRDIYTISMRTELAKQFLLEGIKNERTIKDITPQAKGLLKLLQKGTSDHL